MSLAVVVDTTISTLADSLGAGIAVTDRVPTTSAELPHVAVSVSDAERPQIGIGATPSGPEHGALQVTATIDLADPRLVSGGETIQLLDPTRRTLVVPNGPIVTSLGTEGPPFGPADFTITDPAGSWTIVDVAPVGRQARIDPDAGSIGFGQAVPDAGTMTLRYHVGVWDVTVTRYTGELHLDIVTAAADASQVARRVADALAPLESSGGPFQRLVPTEWGTAGPTTVDTGDHSLRRLTYQFVFERREPALTTSGGVIRRVGVTIHIDGATELDQIPIPT